MTTTRLQWDTPTKARLHALAQEGKSRAQMAEEFGTTRGSIQAVMDHYSLYPGTRFRKCMGCPEYFGSSWNGNRMCNRCLNRPEGML